MNRAARRAEARRLPRSLRSVPIVSVTPQHFYEHFRNHADGDIVTLKGMKRGPRGGLVKCEPGQETPVKLELRK